MSEFATPLVFLVSAALLRAFLRILDQLPYGLLRYTDLKTELQLRFPRKSHLLPQSAYQ